MQEEQGRGVARVAGVVLLQEQALVDDGEAWVDVLEVGVQETVDDSPRREFEGIHGETVRLVAGLATGEAVGRVVGDAAGALAKVLAGEVVQVGDLGAC